jgi:hypothetical protein
MKRPLQDVAGRPKVRDALPDVAGRMVSPGTLDLDWQVQSYCHVLRDPLPTAADDATLIEDFRDFLAGDDGSDSERLPLPDPIFRDRLRRRLWINFVHSHLGKAGEKLH